MSASRSWIWSHFKKIDVKVGSVEVLSWANTNAACNICCNLALTDSKIKWATPYTANHSPGHLERHLKSYHNDLLVDRREVAAAEEVTGRITITDYYQKHPEFEDLYLKWAVETYQPLNTIEGVRFRAMCRSLSPHAPLITKARVMNRLLQVEANVKFVFKKILEGQHVAITLDHWTSIANVNYVAQTAHFITDQWVLKSCTLACTVHKGGSDASSSEKVSD